MRALALLFAFAATPLAAEPRVVTDIAPVQSLVASVMQGAGEPVVLLPSNADPHHLSLRPSQARDLATADAVFWIGSAMTPWLQEPVETLPQDARAVALLEVPGTHLIGSDHGDGHGQVDPHAWLDPENAVLWLDAIARTLSDVDPDNASLYTANAATAKSALMALEADLSRQLLAVSGKRFLVAHDAFSYFAGRFDVALTFSVSESDAEPPSAGRLAELRDDIASSAVTCAFHEPQQSDAVLATVLEGSDTPIAILDPLGSEVPPGPGHYAEVLRNLARAVLDCGGT